MLKLLHNCTHLTRYSSNAQNSPSQASTIHKLWTFVSQKKQESSIKTSISALLTMPKRLTVWITIHCWKFLKKWEYQTTWPVSWEICMQVRKQVRTGHGTTDWFQIGKRLHQGRIWSPCLFNSYAEYTSWETLGWMKHKLESRLVGEISITSDMQMTPPLWQKAKN